jgi:hypothetical protein
MVRDSGLAYRGMDDGEREVYCPVCLKFRAGVGLEVVTIYARLFATRESIARHLSTQRHEQALDEEKREAARNVRCHRVGLNIARTAI